MPVGLSILEFFEIDIRETIASGWPLRFPTLFQTVGLDVVNHLLQACGKLVEILFVKEDFVFVVCKPPVLVHFSFTLRNGEIVVIAFGGFDIEEIRTLARSHWLRIYIFT